MKIRLNGQERQLERIDSVADLIRSLELAPEQVAVELNSQLIARSKHASVQLSEGDEVEIVTMVGGG